DDLAAGIDDWNGARKGPAQCSIDTAHAVFELKRALRANRLADDAEHVRLILRSDVCGEPAAARFAGVRNEASSLEVVHLAPVRVHPVHRVGACKDERAEATLAFPQGGLPFTTHPSEMQMRFDPRQQFACTERLHDVIVGAGSPALDSRLFAGAR